MIFLPQFIFRSPIFSTNKKIEDSVFAEALYLSTPALYDEQLKHSIKPITDIKDLKKLNISLYKYQSRASFRPTPFGLFAGLSIGNWQEQNSIKLNADLNQTLKRKTRLDMNVLCSLAQELAKQPFIKPHLKFNPNTSIYLVGNSYRYVEYYYNKTSRFHKINRVDYTTYLDHILNESKLGLTHQQLTHLLINDEISQQEATDFIDELISSQILINQLEPTVTGPDYFEVLLLNLKHIFETNHSNELNNLIVLLTEVLIKYIFFSTKLIIMFFCFRNS